MHAASTDTAELDLLRKLLRAEVVVALRHLRILPRRPVEVCVRSGRSPGSRIVLLPAPSQPRGQWLVRVSSPITVTGSRRFRTAFPGPPMGTRSATTTPREYSSRRAA